MIKSIKHIANVEVVTNVEIFQWYKHSFVVIIGTNCYEDLLLKLHTVYIICKFDASLKTNLNQDRYNILQYKRKNEINLQKCIVKW